MSLPSDDAAPSGGSDDQAVRSQGTSFVWSLILSVIIAILCLGVLLNLAGAWDFLAVTRLLDLLIEGGFIQYHDTNRGFIAGLPNVELYFLSQDPIDWGVAVVGAGLMLLYPAIKAAQFHLIARIYGSTATFGQHVSAYFYGDGLDRFLPFNFGRAAMATILAKYGLSPSRAAGAVFMSTAMTVFEIVFFALVGLAFFGWMGWFSQIFWAIVILGVAYFLVAPRAKMRPFSWGQSLFPVTGEFLLLARQMPIQFAQLGILSVLAFGSLDVASYVMMSALETDNVLIGIDPPILLLGLVGGYIASRIVTVTPGGIGQWELGFATGLFMSGAQSWLPLFVIAIVVNFTRIVTGLSLMAIVMWRSRIPTSLGEVLSTSALPPERTWIEDSVGPSTIPAHRPAAAE